MKRAEAAERDVAAHRLRVLRGIGVLRRVDCAHSGFGCAGVGHGRLDDLAGRRHDPYVDVVRWERVAGFDHRVRGFRVKRRIGLLEERPGRARLHGGSVVDEVPDRNAVGERRHGAVVVAVPVRRDEMVDLRDARVPQRVDDPARVALGRRAAVPGVDEQGLAAG